MKTQRLATLYRFISEHKLSSILSIGILVRVLLIPFSSHPFDMYVWFDNSLKIIHNGPASVHFFPPLWGHYIMIPIAYAYDALSKIVPSGLIPMASLPSALNFFSSYNAQYVPGMLFNFVAKFPFLLSDIFITLLLYKIILEMTKNKALAEKAALLWFLNPVVIWIGASWGMWDTLPALCSLACFFFLLKNRIGLSAIFLSLGVALKLYPILFLIPIVIYFSKSSSGFNKRKNTAKFCVVLALTSLLLLGPYIGVPITLSNFFIPNSLAVTNPVVEPIGFGLTYWSIYLVNRLAIVPINVELVNFLSILSLVVAAISITLVYWKTSKLPFKKPSDYLIVTMLLTILAVFLSYRTICEQWIVWILPLLTVLCVKGWVKTKYYWGASVIALLYGILNCPLPLFFLPLSPWIGNGLLEMMYTMWTIEPVIIVTLILLGFLFSVLMLLVTLRIVRRQDFQEVALKKD